MIVVFFVLNFASADSGEPKIKPFQFTSYLRVGMRDSVICAVVYGDAPFQFSWFKDGEPLTDLLDISVRNTDDFTSNLVISKVDANSNGNYTCKVSNSKGSDEMSAVLAVKATEEQLSNAMMIFVWTATVLCLVTILVSAGPGEPKIKSFHFSNELELGMRETVHCNVLSGDTPLEFSWFKDGQILTDGQDISVRKTDDYGSRLVISKVNADSNGNYSCRATNSKGFDEKSAVLSVKGV
ncbi:titin [Trichonephila clavipes]|uniref:Titin n=1 Tax=Trichonephila clavipes TaxID=2585209 RepID=A0A8X6SE29_TRICX|nr:titin [Trichonephila clavipes]